MEFSQLVVPVVVVAEFQRASIHLDNLTVALAGHSSRSTNSAGCNTNKDLPPFQTAAGL